MNDDIESRLRAALRPVAPDTDFSRKLLAAVAAEQPQARPRWWIPAALAASVLMAVGVQHQVQASREYQNGLRARREVVEALRMTSQKLNLAYETVKSESSALDDEKPGV
jgi:uncharacterized membrane protein YhhN